MSERYTYNQINDQISSAYMNRTGASPTVLVKRSLRPGENERRITVGRLNLDTREVHFSEDGREASKPISMETLSDKHQAQLATELAGVALRGDGVTAAPNEAETSSTESGREAELAAVEASLAELKESMDESDRIPAWRYATALHDSEIYSALGQLSDEGKSQAIKYRDLYQKLQKLRSEQT